MMYVITNKNLQDTICNHGWAKDWVWCTAYQLVNKFGTDRTVQLIPPSAEAYSKQWHTYRQNIQDILMELLPKISFNEVYEEWEWRTAEQKHLLPPTFGGATGMDFCWNFLRAKDSTIEILMCFFGFNMNKYGTFDYEFLGFSHKDIDDLFHWNREIQ